MPPKIPELMADRERAGFVDRSGKGSHRNFVHPKVARPVTVSGNSGEDAKQYQTRAVRLAMEESRNSGETIRHPRSGAKERNRSGVWRVLRGS